MAETSERPPLISVGSVPKDPNNPNLQFGAYGPNGGGVEIHAGKTQIGGKERWSVSFSFVRRLKDAAESPDAGAADLALRQLAATPKAELALPAPTDDDIVEGEFTEAVATEPLRLEDKQAAEAKPAMPIVTPVVKEPIVAEAGEPATLEATFPGVAALQPEPAVVAAADGKVDKAAVGTARKDGLKTTQGRGGAGGDRDRSPRQNAVGKPEAESGDQGKEGESVQEHLQRLWADMEALADRVNRLESERVSGNKTDKPGKVDIATKNADGEPLVMDRITDEDRAKAGPNSVGETRAQKAGRGGGKDNQPQTSAEASVEASSDLTPLQVLEKRRADAGLEHANIHLDPRFIELSRKALLALQNAGKTEDASLKADADDIALEQFKQTNSADYWAYLNAGVYLDENGTPQPDKDPLVQRTAGRIGEPTANEQATSASGETPVSRADKVWNGFVLQNPEKAAIYAPGSPEIAAALKRYESQKPKSEVKTGTTARSGEVVADAQTTEAAATANVPDGEQKDVDPKSVEGRIAALEARIGELVAKLESQPAPESERVAALEKRLEEQEKTMRFMAEGMARAIKELQKKDGDGEWLAILQAALLGLAAGTAIDVVKEDMKSKQPAAR